jgi:Lon protease-like protein
MDLLDVARRRLLNRTDIPVFPLPDVVFFPETTLGLHIFEPRYRRMTEEALASDRLIAMALLRPGWEGDYHGSPPVHAIACAGVIEQHVRLPDGRFNIMLRGLCRIRVGEFVRETPYRVAAFLPESERNATGGPAAEEARQRLLQTCIGLMREIGPAGGQPFVPPPDMPFAVGVNLLCQRLAMEPDRRQRLLEIDDLVARSEAVVDILTERWRRIVADPRGPDGIVH